MLPADSCAVRCLELEDHGEESGVYVPDAGKDEADDGETGHTPHKPHLHIQQPWCQTVPLIGPELFTPIPLNNTFAITDEILHEWKYVESFLFSSLKYFDHFSPVPETGKYLGFMMDNVTKWGENNF